MHVLRSTAVWSSLLLAGSCSDPAPSVTDWSWSPSENPRVPLAARVGFTTQRPVRPRVLLDDGDRTRVLARWDEPRTEHDLLLLGFRPDTRYELSLELEDAAGGVTHPRTWEWTTPPLPESFPPLHVTVSRPALMEPGVTFVPCNRWLPGAGLDRGSGALVALDERGDVVWFYDAPHAISEVKRLHNGNLIYHTGTNGNVFEMDMLGTIVRQWYTTRLPGVEPPEDGIPIDASTIHHDVQELPSGDFLALSTELRNFESYPASEVDPTVPRAPSRVIGDVILRYRPDGTVTDRVAVLDVLDPYRIGYESLDWGFWSHVYRNDPEEPLRDWSHVNSVDYDAEDNAIIVSSYHQDAVFKYDLDERELVWILGFPSGWGQRWRPYLLDPVGEGLYPFHQHSARMTPQGTLLMFDNGKYRALPYAPKMNPEESFSRAVEFAIDEERGEFRELWSYGGRPGELFFTPFLGEAEWLPEKGHVLVTDGGRILRADGLPGVHPNQGRKWARVFEVTHETPARVVFEVVIDDLRSGWTVYRSERLPGLYPPR